LAQHPARTGFNAALVLLSVALLHMDQVLAMDWLVNVVWPHAGLAVTTDGPGIERANAAATSDECALACCCCCRCYAATC